MTEMVPLTTVPLPVKLRAADYLMLDEAGAFEPYGKTELLDGEIVYMNAQHRPHARMKMAMYDALLVALQRAGSPLTALVEASIALGYHDTPEPDLLLTSEPDGEGLVPVGSVALIVEVADTTLGSDLARKAPLYARGNVPEYWVIDLNGRVVHQMWSAQNDRFEMHRVVALSEALTAETIPGLMLDPLDP